MRQFPPSRAFLQIPPHTSGTKAHFRRNLFDTSLDGLVPSPVHEPYWCARGDLLLTDVPGFPRPFMATGAKRRAAAPPPAPPPGESNDAVAPAVSFETPDYLGTVTRSVTQVHLGARGVRGNLQKCSQYLRYCEYRWYSGYLGYCRPSVASAPYGCREGAVVTLGRGTGLGRLVRLVAALRRAREVGRVGLLGRGQGMRVGPETSDLA